MRNAFDWTPRFGAVIEDFAGLGVRSAVIDNEAVVLAASGVSDVSALQRDLKNGAAARIQMMAFDLLRTIKSRRVLREWQHWPVIYFGRFPGTVSGVRRC